MALRGVAGGNSGGGATGDVVGPVTATDNAVVRFDGTTGELIQNSGIIVDDSNNITGIAQATATTFVGALTGNADTATTATNVTVANEATDTTCFPLFATAATGNLPPKSNASLTFNSNTAALATTGTFGAAGITSTVAISGTAFTTAGVTTGTGVAANTVTTGTAVSATGLTTGTGLLATTGLTSGKGMDVGGTATTSGIGLNYNTTSATASTQSALTVSGTATMTADYTGKLIDVNPTKTHTAAATRAISGAGHGLNVSPTYSITGTLASVTNVSGATANISRTISNASSSASSSMNVTGPLLALTNTKGTATNPVVDSARIIDVNQANATASGAAVYIANAGTGPSLQVASGSAQFGTNGGTVGSLKLFGNTSGDVTVKAAAAAGTATNFTLPATNGTVDYLLRTDGSGNTSWVAPSAGTPKVTVLAMSTTAASVTGTTSETTLATYTLPANTLPSNGVIRITCLWSRTGAAGANTTRVRFGGIGGTIYGSASMGASAVQTMNGSCFIYSNNSSSAQKYQGTITLSTPYSNQASALVTSAVNTTSSADIVFTAQLVNSADSAVLESYIIEMLTP